MSAKKTKTKSKQIPLVIISYNQLTYLKNLVNWWQWYRPNDPIYIVDNNSDYPPLLEWFHSLHNQDFHPKLLVRTYDKNAAWENLRSFLADNIDPNYYHYIITPPDVIPHPGTPPNFIDVFKYAIEHIGFHHVGFGIIVDDLPHFIDNHELIMRNEVEWWNPSRIVNLTYKERIYQGYKAPIDAAFVMYKSEDGWSNPMPGDKWANSLRLFKAHHLPYYLDPNNINDEMDYYFTHCKKKVVGEASTGANNYRPNQYQ